MSSLNKIRSEIKLSLDKLPRHLCVEFALYCCDDIKDLIKDEAPIKAVALTKKWLKDEGSVTQAELKTAAASASAYVSAASAATYVSAYAFAAYAFAAYAADQVKKMTQYRNHLDLMIQTLTPLEKLIYDLN